MTTTIQTTLIAVIAILIILASSGCGVQYDAQLNEWRAFNRKRKFSKNTLYVTLYEDKDGDGFVSRAEMSDLVGNRIDTSETEFAILPYFNRWILEMNTCDVTITNAKNESVYTQNSAWLPGLYTKRLQSSPFTRKGVVYPLEIGTILREATKECPGEFTFTWRPLHRKGNLSKTLFLYLEGQPLIGIRNNLLSSSNSSILIGKYQDFDENNTLSAEEMKVIDDLPINIANTNLCIASSKALQLKLSVYSPDGKIITQKLLPKGDIPIYLGSYLLSDQPEYGIRLIETEQTIRQNPGAYIFVIEQGFDSFSKEVTFIAN